MQWQRGCVLRKARKAEEKQKKQDVFPLRLQLARQQLSDRPCPCLQEENERLKKEQQREEARIKAQEQSEKDKQLAQAKKQDTRMGRMGRMGRIGSLHGASGWVLMADSGWAWPMLVPLAPNLSRHRGCTSRRWSRSGWCSCFPRTALTGPGWSSRFAIDPPVPTAKATRRQGDKAARWQGGKVARWQGGKVTLASGGSAIERPTFNLLFVG